MKLKKIYLNYTKEFKTKNNDKKIKIKIEIQNKFYFWLKGKIEKKINFTKEYQKNKK
jgi:hypothetical protein